jgi:hypothetical protein
MSQPVSATGVWIPDSEPSNVSQVVWTTSPLRSGSSPCDRATCHSTGVNASMSSLSAARSPSRAEPSSFASRS